MSRTTTHILTSWRNSKRDGGAADDTRAPSQRPGGVDPGRSPGRNRARDRRTHEQHHADARECPGIERLDAEEKRRKITDCRRQAGTMTRGLTRFVIGVHPPSREASADRRSLGEGGRAIVFHRDGAVGPSFFLSVLD